MATPEQVREVTRAVTLTGEVKKSLRAIEDMAVQRAIRGLFEVTVLEDGGHCVSGPKAVYVDSYDLALSALNEITGKAIEAASRL